MYGQKDEWLIAQVCCCFYFIVNSLALISVGRVCNMLPEHSPFAQHWICQASPSVHSVLSTALGTGSKNECRSHTVSTGVLTQIKDITEFYCYIVNWNLLSPLTDHAPIVNQKYFYLYLYHLLDWWFSLKTLLKSTSGRNWVYAGTRLP